MHSWARELNVAASVLRAGGIVAYATESCFGLGCDPRNRQAVMRLLGIKRRPADKGVILIAANIEQLMPYVARFPRKTLTTWPGPYTWLLEPKASVPRWIRGRHPRIAVRLTAHAQAAALCQAAGMAIVSTSANCAGQRPARSYREVQRRLGAELDYVLRGRIGDRKAPTPITDAATGKIVRLG
ncbi:MAG: Sua5/YciO/YrdC/YwlC family protein [Acidiferrobacterales bacterium]|nr:Sua5/YciO/YrdC/YwlC family protein [Acidiferrobacterales bacterium]